MSLKSWKAIEAVAILGRSDGVAQRGPSCSNSSWMRWFSTASTSCLEVLRQGQLGVVGAGAQAGQGGKQRSASRADVEVIRAAVEERVGNREPGRSAVLPREQDRTIARHRRIEAERGIKGALRDGDARRSRVHLRPMLEVGGRLDRQRVEIGLGRERRCLERAQRPQSAGAGLRRGWSRAAGRRHQRGERPGCRRR